MGSSVLYHPTHKAAQDHHESFAENIQHARNRYLLVLDFNFGNGCFFDVLAPSRAQNTLSVGISLQTVAWIHRYPSLTRANTFAELVGSISVVTRRQIITVGTTRHHQQQHESKFNRQETIMTRMKKEQNITWICIEKSGDSYLYTFARFATQSYNWSS
jgi:hypothetical protein